MWLRFSTTRTRWPAPAARRSARTLPAKPAPTISQSNIEATGHFRLRAGKCRFELFRHLLPGGVPGGGLQRAVDRGQPGRVRARFKSSLAGGRELPRSRGDADQAGLAVRGDDV